MKVTVREDKTVIQFHSNEWDCIVSTSKVHKIIKRKSMFRIKRQTKNYFHFIETKFFLIVFFSLDKLIEIA